jgi:hypothetical protein
MCDKLGSLKLNPLPLRLLLKPLMQSFLHRPKHHASPLLKAVAVLCVFLVMLVGAAQLLHAHPASAPADASCSLCVVAHLSASPAPVIAGPVSVFSLSVLLAPGPVLTDARPITRVFRIRPPPSLTPHA